MFEILKALRDLNEACKAHGTRLVWDITDNPEGGLAIRAEVPVTDEDQAFVEGMRRMFEPVAEGR